MTPEQRIERARLVRMFLDSDEFTQAWGGVEAELLREFRDALEPERALEIHEQMKAMQRLMARWKSAEVDAAIARKERDDRERKRKPFFG